MNHFSCFRYQLAERKEVSAVLTNPTEEGDDKDSLDEDMVIALPLKQWPQPLWKSFGERKPVHLQSIMEKLKGVKFWSFTLLVSFMKNYSFFKVRQTFLE